MGFGAGEPSHLAQETNRVHVLTATVAVGEPLGDVYDEPPAVLVTTAQRTGSSPGGALFGQGDVLLCERKDVHDHFFLFFIIKWLVMLYVAVFTVLFM
jgi:hypothetical protein